MFARRPRRSSSPAEPRRAPPARPGTPPAPTTTRRLRTLQHTTATPTPSSTVRDLKRVRRDHAKVSLRSTAAPSAAAAAASPTVWSAPAASSLPGRSRAAPSRGAPLPRALLLEVHLGRELRTAPPVPRAVATRDVRLARPGVRHWRRPNDRICPNNDLNRFARRHSF
jgi:hypothetical protein